MQQLHGKALVNQTVDLDTKTIRKSGVVADGSLTSWLYVHWDTLKDFIRRITGINNVIRVKAVFTSNITISASGATVDGYTLLNNDIVLVAEQTDTTQNGLYTWNTGGALTRLAPFTPTFAAGLAILNIALQGRIFHVLNGNINRNTFWYFDCDTQFPIIGTSSLIFYNVANLKVSTASNNLIIQGTDGIEVKLKNTGDIGGEAVFGGLQYDPTTREFYIITSLMPGASGSLTIENYLGTVLGVASKMQFSVEFSPVWDGVNSRITVNLAEGRGVQTGTVIYDAFDTASNPAVPAGYLLCNGQTVDGDNALFTALRTRLQSQFITNTDINRPVIPFLTQNIDVSGYIASQSTNDGNLAWRAFDDTIAATAWFSAIWSADSTPPTAGGEWVQIQTPSPIFVDGFTIVRDSVSATTTYDYTVQYKLNLGDSWTNIGVYTNASGTNTQTFTQITGRYFRILVTRVNSSQGKASIRNFFLRQVPLSPIRYFQVPNLSNLATGIRPIIKI